MSEYIIKFSDCVAETHMALTGQPPQSFYGQPLTYIIKFSDCVAETHTWP